MTTYRRNSVPGGSYFFTVNLHDRRSRLLFDHVELLRAAFRATRRRHMFTVDAIAVPPDHLHTIWTLPEGDADFPLRWALIKADFSRRLPKAEPVSQSRLRKRERGIWQRRFWEHTLRDEDDFARHVSDMLNALVHNSGLHEVLDAIISIESKKVFKPSPAAYTLIEAGLGVSPADVLFVSCNPFDVCGAKSFGLQVAWIEHVTPEAMKNELADPARIAPLTMFKMLREQMDNLGFLPDYRVHALSELPKVVFRTAS